ncbi:MAG: hypothetical protein WBC33_06560 [Conexibacter sp.]
MSARVPILAAILALCCAPAAFAADPAPEYFNLPAGYNANAGIAPASDGTIWFATTPAGPTPSLGRLTVAQATPGTANGMATFPTPTQPGTSCCANGVRSVAFDAVNKRLWFVQSDGIVGYANVAAVVPGSSAGMVDRLPANPADLWDIAVAPDGLAWFTEHSAHNVAPYPGNRIASIDGSLNIAELSNIALQGGRVTLDSLRYDAKPSGITVAPDGTPWFAEADPGNPGYRIAKPNGSDYTEYLITPCGPGSPCSGSFTGTGPTDVAVAKDGSIWFTNQLKNEVGRLDPLGGTFTNYSLPAIDAGLGMGQARAVSVAADGSLWVAEYGGISFPNANAIVKIVPGQPSPTATVWHLGAGKSPLAVAPDTSGNVWFAVATTSAPGMIGRLAGVFSSSGGGGGGGGGGTTITPSSVGVARIGTPTVKGTSVSANQICVGPPKDPCTLVYLLSTHEYVTGFPGSKASAAKKKRKPKPVILGQKTVTLHGGQRKLVTIKLNRTGRKLLKNAPNGKLKVFFTATQKGAKGKPPKRIKAVKLTFKLPSR